MEEKEHKPKSWVPPTNPNAEEINEQPEDPMIVLAMAIYYHAEHLEQALNRVADGLYQLATGIKGQILAEDEPTPVVSPSKKTPVRTKKKRTPEIDDDDVLIADWIEAFRQQLDSRLFEMLHFSLDGDDLIIKKDWSESKRDFAVIAGVVRGWSGEWVKKGKESHFKIPLGG